MEVDRVSKPEELFKKLSALSAQYVLTRVENDWLGRGPIRQYSWTGRNGGGTVRITENAYDLVGNLLRKRLPNGDTYSHTYDSTGNLVLTEYPDGSTSSASCDRNGRMTTSTDRRGKTTVYKHNEADVVVEKATGLESAQALANALKLRMNDHYVDAGAGSEEHKTADAQIVAPDAEDINSLYALVSALQDSYAGHDDDATLSSGWIYHQGQGTARALHSEVNPDTFKSCVEVLNDLKAKFNLHVTDTVAHTSGDSTAVAVSDASGTIIKTEHSHLGPALVVEEEV